MKRSRTIIVISCLTVVAITAKAIPLFGGLPVYDGASHVESILHTSKLVAQIKQMVETYEKIKQQYDHMERQAKYMRTLERYRTPMTVWRGMSTTDTYGKTGAWIGAVNQGVGSSIAWRNATSPVEPFSASAFPPSQQSRRQLDYATLELQDGAAVSAIDTIGRVRMSGPRTDAVLDMLESDSLSVDPNLHTEAAQLNKANAISVVQAKALIDQNKLLVANAEIALLEMRQRREAAARSIEDDKALRKDGRAWLDAQWAGASSKMRNFRLP